MTCKALSYSRVSDCNSLPGHAVESGGGPAPEGTARPAVFCRAVPAFVCPAESAGRAAGRGRFCGAARRRLRRCRFAFRARGKAWRLGGEIREARLPMPACPAGVSCRASGMTAEEDGTARRGAFPASPGSGTDARFPAPWSRLPFQGGRFRRSLFGLEGQSVHLHLPEHGRQAVASGGGKMLFQSDTADEVKVGVENLLRGMSA